MRLVIAGFAVALSAWPIGGCQTQRGTVFDRDDRRPPGVYGLYASGSDRPLATHELKEGEVFGVEYEGWRRYELVLRPTSEASVRVMRVAVDPRRQYEWRRIDGREP